MSPVETSNNIGNLLEEHGLNIASTYSVIGTHRAYAAHLLDYLSNSILIVKAGRESGRRELCK